MIPTITPELIESRIIAEHYLTGYEARMGSIIEGQYESRGRLAGTDIDLENIKLVTFCMLVLDNGFVATGTSACASKLKFDRDIGRGIARKNAIEQIWPVLGFELRSQLARQEDSDSESLTHLLAHSLGNTGVLSPSDTQLILAELIPRNLESNEAIARICHEANKSWCEINGDYSQPAWEEAPQWMKDSAISGVAFHRANPDAGDSASHDEWMRHKLADGWRYGPVKDPESKTHPCIMPFENLPHAQQFKDRLFRTIVHASLKPSRPSSNHLRLVRADD